MLPPTEIERMQRDYDERLEVWERRRAEIEREEEGEEEGMGGEEGGQGGFTAVNG